MKATISKRPAEFDITETYDITACFDLIKQLDIMARNVIKKQILRIPADPETVTIMAEGIISIREYLTDNKQPPGGTLLRARCDRENNRRRRREHELESTIAALKSQIQFLNKDNVKLQEKLRSEPREAFWKIIREEYEKKTEKKTTSILDAVKELKKVLMAAPDGLLETRHALLDKNNCYIVTVIDGRDTKKTEFPVKAKTADDAITFVELNTCGHPSNLDAVGGKWMKVHAIRMRE